MNCLNIRTLVHLDQHLWQSNELAGVKRRDLVQPRGLRAGEQGFLMVVQSAVCSLNGAQKVTVAGIQRAEVKVGYCFQITQQRGNRACVVDGGRAADQQRLISASNCSDNALKLFALFRLLSSAS